MFYSLIFFFYGINTLEYGNKRPKDIPCVSCGKQGEMFVRYFVKYWHVFYIPIFPYWMWSQVECVHCKVENDYSELSPESKEVYRKFMRFKFPPIWTFMGTLLILGAITWTSVNSWKSRQKMRERLVNLEVGRFLDYKKEDGPSARFRVVEITEDQASLVLDPPKDLLLPKDDFPDAYGKDTLILNRKLLLDWFDIEKLASVHW